MNAAYFLKVKGDLAIRMGQDGSHPFRVSADRRERSSGREAEPACFKQGMFAIQSIRGKKNQQVELGDLQSDCSLPRCE